VTDRPQNELATLTRVFRENCAAGLTQWPDSASARLACGSEIGTSQKIADTRLAAKADGGVSVD